MPKSQVIEMPKFSSKDLSSHFEKSFPESDLLRLELFWLHRQISSVVESKIESMLSQYDLSSGRYLLMMMLNQHPEGLRPTELAYFSGVTQATISGLLIALEKSNLILRENNKSDARSFVIKMTAHGNSLYKKLQPDFLTLINANFTALTQQELEFLQKIFVKMSSAVQTSPSSASLN